MFPRLTNPAYPLNRLREEFDRVLGPLLDDGLAFRPFGQPAYPAVNIWEDAEAIHAEAEVPGLKMSDLEILVMGRELTIKGRREPAGGEGLTYHRQERGTGEFSRTLRLPVEIDANKVAATLRDGVLAITLPKAPEARPRRIEVKSNNA